MAIIRTEEEVRRVRSAAQAASFSAEDAGDSDDVAEAVYGTLQWLLGDTDTDPVEQYIDVGDDDDAASEG